MLDAKSRVTASTQGRASRITQKVLHDKYNSKCVCEICTCGIHRCPPTQRRRFEGHTTNQDDYRPYRIEQDRPATPVYQVKQRHYDPAALQTTYNAQYTPKKAPRDSAGYLDRSVQYLPRKTPFYSQTQYNTKYLPKPLARVDPAQSRYQYRPNRAKFEGTTSYNAEFTPKKPQRQLNPEVEYHRKNIPFQGQSSYQAQYKRYTIAQDRNEPEYKYRPSTAKFMGESRYKEDYHPYAKGNYVQQERECPIYVLPPYPPECSPGKRHLNYSAEKNYWE